VPDPGSQTSFQELEMVHECSTGSVLLSLGLPTERRVIPSASDTASTHSEGSHTKSAVTVPRESRTSRKRQPQSSSSSRLTSSTSESATPFDATDSRGPAVQHARARPVLSPTSRSVEALSKRTYRATSHPVQPQPRAPVKFRNLASSDTVRRTSSAHSAYPDLHRLKGPTVYDDDISRLAFDTAAAANNNSRQAAKSATQVRHQYTSLSVGRDKSTYPAWARVGTGQTLRQSIASSFLTLVANVLYGLVIVLHMCTHAVIAPARWVFAACISSQPPWAASSPFESSACPQQPFDEDCTQLQNTRRPSTELVWISEALMTDYGFSV